MSKIALALVLLLLIGCVPTTPPSVSVTWSTASGMNVAGFVIERSATAAGPFERVAFIPAGADPFVAQAYEYLDRNVRSGETYTYQLVTIHNDNSRSDAGTISATAR
jgi:hypothetical protein